MKHAWKITILLIAMFFFTQLVGLMVLSYYAPEVKPVTLENGSTINITTYHLPYGTEPPADTAPEVNLISILVGIALGVGIMLLLMKLPAEMFLRAWFFLVVSLALAITLNAIFSVQTFFPAQIIAGVLAIAIAYLKVYRRYIIAHNISELFIYPGIAAIFVPLLNIWTAIILFIAISIYDIYAVWHAGFMQKMAKYQIKQLRFFSGFFIPYLGNAQREKLNKLSKRQKKNAKVKMSVAILGGGDVVFPIMLAGVVLHTRGFFPAILVSIGATLALALLFYFSKKGKFYPAMPFITAGCFVALPFAYLL